MSAPPAPPDPEACSDPRHRRGLLGELAARDYLLARGWVLLAHRYRFGRHDLDLIVRRGAVVAFVEVKARLPAGYGSPAEAVGWRKRRILERGAEWWRLRHERPGDRFRFDVVAVEFGPEEGGPPRVMHLEDAWRPA